MISDNKYLLNKNKTSKTQNKGHNYFNNFMFFYNLPVYYLYMHIFFIIFIYIIQEY